jgi:hypothetical protein
MEDIGVLQTHLVSLMMQSCPSHVLVIIVPNMVEFILEGINKILPTGFCTKCGRFISIVSLSVTFPPIFDMGKGLKECKSDIFDVQIILNREITL